LVTSFSTSNNDAANAPQVLEIFGLQTQHGAFDAVQAIIRTGRGLAEF
jgi:hypothetical protein